MTFTLINSENSVSPYRGYPCAKLCCKCVVKIQYDWFPSRHYHDIRSKCLKNGLENWFFECYPGFFSLTKPSLHQVNIYMESTVPILQHISKPGQINAFHINKFFKNGYLLWETILAQFFYTYQKFQKYRIASQSFANMRHRNPFQKASWILGDRQTAR